MTFNKRASLLAVFAASLIGQAAQAGVVASSEPLGAFYGAWSNHASGQNFLMQFTLGEATTLTGFDIFTFHGYTGVGAGVTVKIRADDGGNPAAGNLYQFNDTVDGQAAYDMFSDVSSVNFDGITLAAGTYWMGVAGISSDLTWVTYNNGSSTPLDQRQLSGDNVTYTPNVYDFAYRIQGEAPRNDVPEPTSWALAAVALAGLGISRRRAAR